jgi:hypothetical protein
MGIIRASTAGAVFPALLLAGVTVGSAVAETATWEASSHRVLLLKIVEQGAPGSALNTLSYARFGTAKAPKRQQLAARRWFRRHTRLAEKHRPEPTKIAQAHAGEAIRTAADVAALPIELEAPPHELAVDVHPMQVVSSREVDEIDLQRNQPELAVDLHPMRVASSRELDEVELQGNQTLMRANSGVASRWAESFAAVGNLADTTGVSEFASVAVAQQLRGGKPTGAPRMLQVLATLSGAAAAGSVAWFLISPMRERRFG